MYVQHSIAFCLEAPKSIAQKLNARLGVRLSLGMACTGVIDYPRSSKHHVRARQHSAAIIVDIVRAFRIN
eukprot:6182705-Pleurochrysis_carterae.AAC.1